jgi:hypothetical protein
MDVCTSYDYICGVYCTFEVIKNKKRQLHKLNILNSQLYFETEYHREMCFTIQLFSAES